MYKGRAGGTKEINTSDLIAGNYFLEIVNSSGERMIRKISK